MESVDLIYFFVNELAIIANLSPLLKTINTRNFISVHLQLARKVTVVNSFFKFFCNNLNNNNNNNNNNLLFVYSLVIVNPLAPQIALLIEAGQEVHSLNYI